MNPTLAKSAPVAIPVSLRPLLEFPRIATLRSRRIKRALDLSITAVLTLAALPLIALISLAILLESGRPVFFRHQRVGRAGRSFFLWKFRTMVLDGDEVLARHLANDPEAAEEWAANRKLRHDPRVTRIGRLLRRTSLDELPQFLNILRGEMSLAGPRPIVEAEIGKYGPAWPLYSLTKPGLTGLWQVSGRNDTSYRRRIELDAAYVRNWTWTGDLQLLARTVKVVLSGRGAY